MVFFVMCHLSVRCVPGIGTFGADLLSYGAGAVIRDPDMRSPCGEPQCDGTPQANGSASDQRYQSSKFHLQRPLNFYY